ncbi:MAG: DUF4294 domain-containing protein [Sphingobacteriaceae bacterium]
MKKASLNKAIFLVLFGLLLLPKFSVSQNELQHGIRCYAIVENNDTIPVFYLNEVDVTTNMVFKTRRQYEQWTRVKYNVKKVYPYAILASAKLKQYDLILSKMEDEDIRKAYLRVCEKDLRHEFEDELKGLSVSQGRVLMKLINRETGKTTYTIVKELRGSFQASMWQALAKLFGNDMKTEYDSQTEDVMIEKAIAMVERGDF